MVWNEYHTLYFAHTLLSVMFMPLVQYAHEYKPYCGYLKQYGHKPYQAVPVWKHYHKHHSQQQYAIDRQRRGHYKSHYIGGSGVDVAFRPREIGQQHFHDAGKLTHAFSVVYTPD